MKYHGSNLLFILLLALAVAASGCVAEETDGIVDVRWTIGGATCSRVGVDRIEVSLVTGRQAVASASANCDDDQVAVTGVPAGTYTAQVFGYQTGVDTPAFIGQEAGVRLPKGGRVSTSVIFLQEAPGAVDLTWRFESGNLCRFEGVGWVQISAFDDRNRVVTDIEMPCDPGASVNDGIGGPGFEYLEAARGVVLEYLFAGVHEIIILGYRTPSSPTAEWEGSGTVDVFASELAPLDIVLTPCTNDVDSLCR